MSKKLDKSWTNCLRMWKWIAEVYNTKGYHRFSVFDLKMQWLAKHRFGHVSKDCFFCDYAVSQGDSLRDGFKLGCPNCPGRLVSCYFTCVKKTYTFAAKPKAFYAKLLELNKKRLS